jgi:branched-chain amino acid transport system permease protein
MRELLQLVVTGTALGCIYALIALGFVLIFKGTDTVNFAQGELMMLGACLGYLLIALAGLSFALAAVLSIAGMFMFGMVLERVVIRPVLGQTQMTVVMLTIGIGYAVRGLMFMFPAIGTDTHVLEIPYRGVVWHAGGIVLSAEHGVVIVVTVVLCALLYFLFKHTKIGIAMQAASQNQLAAYYVGLPVKRLNGLIWGMSAAVATVAGILLAPITFVHVNMGFIGLKAFPAAVIGGFGSLPGAIVGGLLLGIIEALSGFYLPEGFKDIAAYIAVLVMLMIRPSGIFGGTTRKKV